MSHNEKPWRLRLICCGRSDGREYFDTWQLADDFRQAYEANGVGHIRVGIVEKNIWHAVDEAIARLPEYLREAP